jgi:hypothetical protein
MRFRGGKKSACFLTLLLFISGVILSAEETRRETGGEKKTSEIGLSLLYLGEKDNFLFFGKVSLLTKTDADKKNGYAFSLGFGDYHEHHGDFFYIAPMIDYYYSLFPGRSFRSYAFIGAIGLFGAGGGFFRGVFAPPWIDFGAGAKINLADSFGACLEFRLIPFYYLSEITIPVPTIGFYARW